MDAEIEGLDPTNSLESVVSVSTVEDLPLMPFPGAQPSVQAEAVDEAERWDGAVARRESATGPILHTLFNMVTGAASSVIGFLGGQARSLASAIISRTGIAEQNPDFGVWDSERDGNVGGSLVEVGDRDRPRRGRRPYQPPGLASQALRELRDGEIAEGTDSEPGAAGRTESGAGTKSRTGSGHILTQLSCSKASTAVCAAAAAALARAAATTAARNAAAAASTVSSASTASSVTSDAAKDLRPGRDASSSSRTCLRIADYSTVIPLKTTTMKPTAVSNEGANSEDVALETTSIGDPLHKMISTTKRSGESIHENPTFPSRENDTNRSPS